MEIFAKKGKSLDYQAVVEAFEKVRKPKAVGVTVVGEAVVVSASLLFKASITGQPFLLAEDPESTKENGKNSPFEQ